MKINKFKLFAYLGWGLVAVSMVGKCASYASLAVEADPRIYTAAKLAENSLKVLDLGGNYLWNKEIKAQNKGYLTSNSRPEKFQPDEKVSQLEECEQCSHWEVVNYYQKNS